MAAAGEEVAAGEEEGDGSESGEVCIDAADCGADVDARVVAPRGNASAPAGVVCTSNGGTSSSHAGSVGDAKGNVGGEDASDRSTSPPGAEPHPDRPPPPLPPPPEGETPVEPPAESSRAKRPRLTPSGLGAGPTVIVTRRAAAPQRHVVRPELLRPGWKWSGSWSAPCIAPPYPAPLASYLPTGVSGSTFARAAVAAKLEGEQVGEQSEQVSRSEQAAAGGGGG